MAISTVPDPSGSGRVDMFTSPVQQGELLFQRERGLNRNTTCIVYIEVWEVKLYFTHPPEDKKIKIKKDIFTIHTRFYQG